MRKSRFTTEQIIQILQANPDLLADAKSQIAAAGRERGRGTDLHRSLREFMIYVCRL